MKKDSRERDEKKEKVRSVTISYSTTRTKDDNNSEKDYHFKISNMVHKDATD